MIFSNDYTKRGFVIAHILWGSWFLWIYRMCLFQQVASWGKNSFLILVLMTVGFSTWMVVLEIHRYRSFFNIFLNLLFPAGIYTVISYPYKFVLFRNCLIVLATLLGIAYVWLTLSPPIRGTAARKARVMKNRAVWSTLAVRTIFSFASVVFLSGLTLDAVLFTYFGKTLSNFLTYVEYVEAVSFEDSVKGHEEAIEKLKLDTWDDLSLEQRKEVLEEILEAECLYLGISNVPEIVVKDLAPFLGGQYEDYLKTISIAKEYLMKDSSWETLDTLLHETYHCYQRRVVDAFQRVDREGQGLRLFQGVSGYLEEFGDYKSSRDGFSEYYNQSVESDARDYAEQKCDMYFEYLYPKWYMDDYWADIFDWSEEDSTDDENGS